MDRIWIRGTSGSGKTTLGRAVGVRLGIPAVDLDDLNWLPGWFERPVEEFRALVAEIVALPRWAIMGNYGKVRDGVEPAADTVVWLDYSLLVTFERVLRRTIRRTLRGEACCNGNRETLRKAFFARDSILIWCLTTHARRHRDCLAFMAEVPPPGQVRLRHHSPRETRVWLESLAAVP